MYVDLVWFIMVLAKAICCYNKIASCHKCSDFIVTVQFLCEFLLQFIYFLGDFFNLDKLMRKEIDLKDTHELFKVMYTLSKVTLMNKNVQKLLHDPKEEFDVVIAEWMYNELYSG